MSMIRIADLHFCYREGDFGLRVTEFGIDRGETVAVTLSRPLKTTRGDGMK